MGEQRFPQEGGQAALQTSAMSGRAFSDGRWAEAVGNALSLFPTQQTFYTCPAGRKALVGQVTVVAYTGTGTSVSAYCVPSGFSASELNRFVSGAIAANGQALYSVGLLLSPGDTLQASASVANLLAIYASVFEFPSTDRLVPFALSTSQGGSGTEMVSNTITSLYQCPIGKRARLYYDPIIGTMGGTYYNDVNSVNPHLNIHFTPSGGANYQIGEIDNIPQSQPKTLADFCFPALGPGDAWHAITNAAWGSANTGGLNIWGVVEEFEIG